MKNKVITLIMIIMFIGLLVIINNLVTEQNSIASNTVAKENIENMEETGMEIMKVSNENFEEEVMKSDKKVLIDFYADWCGPCQTLSPIVGEVAKENDNIKVVKINIDEEIALATKYGITSIPTLVVVENGETKNMSIGLISKSQVEELIK